MNITPHNPTTPVATVVNPPTEGLRRENNMREMITPPAAVSQSAAEKGAASEKEKAKNPGQKNEDIDFTSIRKQAEAKNHTIAGSSEHQGESHSEQNQQQASNSSSEKTTADKASDDSNSEQSNAEQETGSEDGKDTKKHAQQDHSANEHGEQYSAAEQSAISNLEKRDAEVRAHEQAHASVGGGATGAPSYSYDTGPDGKRYATSGEVSVDLSPVNGNPQATIAKMQTVKAAALAPANPSNQDRRVAATATQTIVKIQTEIATGATESSASGALKRSSVSLQDDNKTVEQLDESNDEFDSQMKQSLNAPEDNATRPKDVDQRAARIEQHYLKINNAYEQAPSYNFQLTA